MNKPATTTASVKKRTQYNALLIDDNEIDNLVTSRMLENTGMVKASHVMTSAMRALAYIRGLSVDELPDLIFVDIRMPEMDGFEFLEEFERLDRRVKDRVSIFMLSSTLDPSDFSRAYACEYVISVLAKPLDPEVMKAQLNA